MATAPVNPPFSPADTGYVCTGSQARNCSAATGTRSTTRRWVVTRMSSETTGTTSSCSWGNTSRNHPMQPARESTAPSKLTETLVTRPANNKEHPKASTKGQAVGTGTSISRGVSRLLLNCSFVSNVAISLPSASQNVNHSKNNDPDHIHKMPVQGKHFHTTGVLPSDSAGKGEDRYNDEHDQSCSDVKRVQADE